MNKSHLFPSGLAIPVIALCLAASSRGEITQGSPSTEELASAMGLRPYCADARFPAPVYARMVATITDANGAQREQEVHPASASEYWRLRVFVFEDAQSRRPRRLIFNIDSSGTVAGNAFIDFPPDSRLARVTTALRGKVFYEVSVPGDSGPKDKFTISLRLETSATPFPRAAWESSTISQPDFKPRPESKTP